MIIAGQFGTGPRCGAKTRQGSACVNAAMRNGRCRMHGGKSTGPRTEAGRAICGLSAMKHKSRLGRERSGDGKG